MVKRSEKFLHHGLPPLSVATICEQIRKLRKVEAAYLVQMQTRKNNDRPMYLLVIQPAFDAFRSLAYIDSDHLAFEANRELEIPGDLTVEIAYGQMKWLKDAVSSLSSSKIFEKY